MKKRWAWRFTVTTKQGTTWGTCPTWRSDFDRFGVEVLSSKIERVLVVGGGMVPCLVHESGHPDVAIPWDNDKN